jgi:ubiquitin carboxyl-terminal hydrolase 7
LDEYTNEEYLVEDNQYQTDDFGKQDAIKGLKFASLPPVLMLHLRRFEYDWMVDANVKINSKLEIYEDLDMSNYLTNLTQNNAKHDETQYMLFGILIH